MGLHSSESRGGSCLEKRAVYGRLLDVRPWGGRGGEKGASGKVSVHRSVSVPKCWPELLHEAGKRLSQQALRTQPEVQGMFWRTWEGNGGRERWGYFPTAVVGG